MPDDPRPRRSSERACRGLLKETGHRTRMPEDLPLDHRAGDCPWTFSRLTRLRDSKREDKCHERSRHPQPRSPTTTISPHGRRIRRGCFARAIFRCSTSRTSPRRSRAWREPRGLSCAAVSIVLLQHLLKWHYQPERQGRGWTSTIREQRGSIKDLLADSPSLRRTMADILPQAYERGRNKALDETGVYRMVETSPWKVEQVLSATYLPETIGHE